MKLFAARFWFEGNSFSPVPTTLAEFEQREWFRGDLARYRATATELAAVAELSDVFVSRCASAPPGGPIEAGLVGRWLDEVLADLQAHGPWDGVYLSLHGAAVATDIADPDRTILAAVRQAIGPTPLAVSFDLHANLPADLGALVDVAVGYKTYPHIDMREAASRALALLGRPMHTAAVKLPYRLHSFHMRTSAGPMAELQALAAAEPVADVSIFGGFYWGDSPHSGPTVTAVAESRADAQAAAGRIAAAFDQRRPRFAVSLPEPAAGLAEALAAPPGLVALLDPADNPLSGGIGDTPLLLATVQAVEVPTVVCFYTDPELVARCRPGEEIEASIGGRFTPLFGPPVPVRATVERVTDGRFVNQGPMERGMEVRLGPTAVLRAGAVRIIVTSSCQAAIDPGFFELHDIRLEEVRLLAIKAKNHFRAAMADRCVRIVEIDCPGPAALDGARLPFRFRLPG